MGYQLGEVLKKIRQSKKYTQKYVSDGKMSRTTYAKIEACEMQPTLGKFMCILEKLDITYEEFKYIKNMYTLNGKEEIVHDFYQLSSNVESHGLNSLINKCELYLKSSSDSVVEDIWSACHAQFLLSTENDFEKAHSYAIKIWERLSNLDSWYSIELKLINNIFFLFPLDTGIAIVERALREINKFSYINGNYGLKPAYLLNMTLLLINNRQFSDACRYADKAIQECAGQKRYDLISIAYARKGIALCNMDKKDPGVSAIKKALEVNSALDQLKMKEAICEEVRQKTDIDPSLL